MGFGKIFKKKKSSTPNAAKAARTPPTASSKGSAPGYSDDLPVKNLLGELNVHSTDQGNLELVIGDVVVPSSETETPAAKEEAKETQEGGAAAAAVVSEEAQASADEEQSEDSPLEPRKLDSEEPETKEADDTAAETAGEAATETAADAAVVTTVTTTDNADASPEEAAAAEGGAEEAKQEEEDVGVAQKLMGFLESAQQLATGIVSEEVVRKLVPTADNDLCQPIGGRRVRSDISGADGSTVRLERQYSYYNDQFALKFLDELLNVGYALVHHEQTVAESAEEDDDADWVGRSVTLILRPGICNAIQVEAPYLEWTTMGGGQQTEINSTAVSLLDVHSISTSHADDAAGFTNNDDENDQGSASQNQQQQHTLEEEEDLRCFFTMTTKQGSVYVMEAITADESQRLVAGVKNLSARLSKQLIAGDESILADFFDNAQEPDEIRFTTNEAMIRLSNTLLDELS